MKNYLFVLRKPAHSGTVLQETLDIILTAAAFDQSVSLLLLDDGVFHLKTQQQPQSAGLKDTAAIFSALEIYDVNVPYIEIQSLEERGLCVTDLSLPVKTISRTDVAAFMQGFDVVFAA